jgi:adenosylcobinamide-GDP ribazoletransferase
MTPGEPVTHVDSKAHKGPVAMKGLDGARSALGLLSIVGRGAAPTPWALPWFSVVGLLIGLGVGTTLRLEGRAGVIMAATLAVAVDLVLTGCLHLDGLADTADGLLPHATTERRFAIMKAPDVGAFALGVVIVVELIRWSAFLTVIEPSIGTAWAIAAIWAWSRTLMAFALMAATPARPGGLSQAFQPTGQRGLLTAATVVTSMAVLALAWWSATRLTSAPAINNSVVSAWQLGRPTFAMMLSGVMATWAGSMAVLLLAKRRLGGYTGDVLGAMCVVGETAGLLAMVLAR